MITKPRHAELYPDRDLDCQMAIEDHFKELIEAAEHSGWTREEALAAVIELAKAETMADVENERTNIAILQALMARGPKH
jgi:hypothetical protein